RHRIVISGPDRDLLAALFHSPQFGHSYRLHTIISSENVAAILETQLPRPPEQIAFRYLEEHRLIRVSQAVMNKADVRAPALIALDLPRFSGSRRTLPEDLEIHIVRPEVPDRWPQFTSTNPSIKIDHGRRFSCSTRHRPRGPVVKVLE